MADISQIRIPNSQTLYNIKDSNAVKTIKVGATSYLPSSGTVNLPAYPEEAQTFKSVNVGSSTITATSATDELSIIAGDGVILTPDTINKSIEISATASSTDLYVLKSEYVYTSTVGGETSFNLANYPDVSDFNSDTDVLLVSIDGLTLNENLYSVVGSVVTLSAALSAGSSISFKILGFGVRGDIETLILAYDRFLTYFQTHQPYFQDNLIVFPEVSYTDFAVDISASSPVYAYAQKFNALLTYLETNAPYFDSENNVIVLPTVDVSPFRFFATRVTEEGYIRVTEDGAERTT